MTRLIDITNLKFGKLLVLGQSDNRSKTGQIFWNCLCDCGKETKVLATSLKSGNTASCGCWKIQANVKYFPQEATARRAFKNYALNSKTVVELSFEEFYKLSQYNCHYCNAPPYNLTHSENNSEWSKSNGDFIYNGMDRIVPSKGYTIENVLICCKYCNKSKCAMTVSEFRSHLESMLATRTTLYNCNYRNIVPPNDTSISISLNRDVDYSKPFNAKIVIGLTLGKWKIINESERDSHGRKRYLCECNCGVQKEVDANNLKSGKSRSCSNPLCYQEYSSDIYKARKIWISRYKDGDLSFEYFYTLSQMSCAYCGVEPLQTITAKDGKQFIYNGIDRLDTSMLHNKNNVVPCCYDCNKIKNDRSLMQLDTWLTNINNHWLNK